MQKEIISTTNAPGAIGPYSQAVKIGGMLYTSGQLPINAVTGELINDDVRSAAKQCLENLNAILTEAGTSLDKVVKTLVFVSDLNDFAAINEVYAQYFKDNYPARSCVQVAKLPLNAKLEIEAIALV
ncbi:MAG: RidA family protein [Clostridium sp.]